MIVAKPRCPGQPINCCRLTNNSNNDKPVMTSGMTSGAVIIPENTVRPRKRPKRHSARPAIAPRTVAKVADVTAMRRLKNAASSTCSLRSNSPYHRVEKPPQTVASRESLNEYTMTRTSGMYRNA